MNIINNTLNIRFKIEKNAKKSNFNNQSDGAFCRWLIKV